MRVTKMKNKKTAGIFLPLFQAFHVIICSATSFASVQTPVDTHLPQTTHNVSINSDTWHTSGVGMKNQAASRRRGKASVSLSQ